MATLLSRFRTIAPDAVVGTVWLNGAPAGRIELAGELDTAVSLVVAEGRITRIYAMRNAVLRRPRAAPRDDVQNRSVVPRVHKKRMIVSGEDYAPLYAWLHRTGSAPWSATLACSVLAHRVESL